MAVYITVYIAVYMMIYMCQLVAACTSLRITYFLFFCNTSLRITSINLVTKSICGTENGENEPKIVKNERPFQNWEERVQESQARNRLSHKSDFNSK